MSRFEIIKALGTQNKRKFNDVFLVRLLSDNSLAVLKVFKKTIQNEHLEKLLRNEANLVFEHPNLPKTLFFQENEKEICVLKNYFDGESLDVFWRKIPKKKRNDFVLILLEKLKPMFDELNQKGLVHGDIKPSNIVIQTLGKDFLIAGFEVYLIDFGMAFYPSEALERKVVFALGFSPPELILNQLHLANQASDIFALGISIYFLYAGNLPLTHPNPAVMTNLQITHPLQANSNVPKVIFKLIERMCFKESFKKPANLLTQKEVESILQKGIQARPQDLGEVIKILQNNLAKKEKSFFWKLIKISSNS